MKIESSDVDLSSISSNERKHEFSTSTTEWITELNATQESKTQRKAQQLKTISLMELTKIQLIFSLEEDLSLVDKLKKELIERLLGRIVGKDDIKFQPNNQNKIKEDENSEKIEIAKKIEWGFSLNIKNEYYQKSSIEFNTKAKIKTEDNKDIDFDVSFAFSKEFYEVHEKELVIKSDNFIDPLIINFKGDIKSFDNISTKLKFTFDINSDGDVEKIPLLRDGSGFLALDKNNNGTIENGNELFGTTSGDGFADLKEYDEDDNDWIDENDAIFKDLRIWEKSESGEDRLITLYEAGVGALYLSSADTNFDYHESIENKIAHLKQSSFYLKEDGKPGLITGIDFVV